MFVQYPFCAVLQFKQAEVQQPEHLGLMLNRFDQQRNNTRNSSARVFITFEPSSQLLADSQTAEAGFGSGPEQIAFPGKMTEDRNFANSCQPRNLMRTAGSEALA
jgi:hypothetical protein